ncbi:hypothetical protein LB519_18245 [Mesorhizobium sp. AD1-1]|uniref:hypothetical protein n=1 Tax=Mesorhizobium sp. AD1-1 TaxID=2876621 RepID=UPI001CCAFBC1|nr:hypothetical protein [Mesorhizobium sp. AD1-1]MBZ9719789.1 hypothetical protein [Mesorhizobium sp. AD1-1]
MALAIVPQYEDLPTGLIAGLADREVSIWIQGTASSDEERRDLARLLRLPWKQAFIEEADPLLIGGLQNADGDFYVGRRGFLHVVDSDPSRIDLPPRSLPIFLLSGRDGRGTSFEQQLRRLTMLEELRRSSIRQLVVISTTGGEPPKGVAELWATGFRTRLMLVNSGVTAAERLGAWLNESGYGPTPSVVSMPHAAFANSLVSAFDAAYHDERLTVRHRDEPGNIGQLDLSGVDDPERPLLASYDIILDRDLAVIDPDDLPEDAFNAFFRGEARDWRAFAAGLPWIRDDDAWRGLKDQLRRLDAVGPPENRVAYIMSEPGAGGTTLARHLAFSAARAGYPTLIAKELPFTPDSLPMINFLTRAKQRAEDSRAQHSQEAGESDPRVYETPWVIIFDRMHWEFRDAELRRFLQQIERAGRPVCIVVVTGPIRETGYYDSSRFKLLATLQHMLDQNEAIQLGAHLNRFLRRYGKERPDWQWRSFQEAHSVRLIEGLAAFWITLSFWLQTQYDLTESIQEWVYRAFKERVDTPELKKAVLQIAALSSERLPMPETLLDQSTGSWPLALLLDDRRSSLSPLGLVRLSDGSDKYWALAHDILGRLLINAVFYDHGERTALGLADARDAEHLRFLILREVSQKPSLGEAAEIGYGEEFATTVFKVDPDHGRASWAHIWRDVLKALDEMPQALRNQSRVFRHHTAISRRRIAWLDEAAYGVSGSDRVSLLERAAEDIRYALQSIERTPRSEPDVNLYNSLANAYFDLVRVRAKQGAPSEELAELRKLASDATRHAYEESPSNPYVIETHVKSLIASAEESSDGAAEYCIEALEIVYAAIRLDQNELRRHALAALADRAVGILLAGDVVAKRQQEPNGPADVLVRAWLTIAAPLGGRAPESLEDVSPTILQAALTELDHSAGAGNPQVLRFKYQVLVAMAPFDFERQIKTLDHMIATDYRLTPQLRLEYALLLFQCMRTDEANRQFRGLRTIWRETDIFGQVPDRLRWLLQPGERRPRVVTAVSAYDHGHRAMARVREFAQFDVPYRPQEFGVREHVTGKVFAAHVSFGHNGAFLRPVTAQPR